MFPYPCPSCDQRLLAPTERAGQRTICPKCLRPLTIPKPESASMEDPKTLIDPSEMPVPVLADTNTPYPGTVPQYAAVGVSAATAVAAGPIELRRAYASEDLTFDLLEVPVEDRSSVSDAGFPRPSDAETPPPHTARPPIRTRRSADHRGMVMLNPTGLFSVDMAAELSAAISMRMKPPPEQLIDRRIIVGAWAFGTLAALGLWLGGLFYNPECLPFVALVGGAMLAFGLLWRAYLVSQDESVSKGVLSLLPPFNIVRLFQKSGENGHRPLRFAASGAIALALFSTGAAARSFVEQKPRMTISLGASTTASKLDDASVHPERLESVLREIGTASAAQATSADDRVATTLLLQNLVKHESDTIRSSALAALVHWSPNDARRWIAAALESRDDVNFKIALGAAAKLPEPEIIAAVARVLQTREHRIEAQNCLVTIGKPAEDALLEMLAPTNEATILSVIDVLADIGGTKSLVALRHLAEITSSATLKSEAASAANELATRLSK